MLVTVTEKRYVIEPIEKKYFQFWLFIFLGVSGI